MKANFLVTVTLPTNVSIQRMRRCIEEAVQTMGGCKDPEDPLFELQHRHVRVQMLGVKNT
ncbi:MAG: hypothetical protein U9N61_10880 [Euryarchaeota archaeon]|nr:hypothetical protein [Euryarchaeota archaeon]